MGRRQGCALVVMLLAGTVPATASATDRYMAPNGTNNGVCADPAAPCATWPYLQLRAATGDTVRLAAGQYDQVFSATKALTIAGPQAGVPAPGRTGPEAVLTGGLAGDPTVELAIRNSVLDGVTIRRGGPGSFGVGVLDRNSSTVRNVIMDGVWRGVSSNGFGVTVEASQITASDEGVTGTGSATITGSVISGRVAITANASLEATGNTLRATDYGVFMADGFAELHGNRIIGVAADGSFDPTVPSIRQNSIWSVYADNNWYGCNEGPPTCGPVQRLNSGGVTVEPHLVLSAALDPGSDAVPAGATVGVEAWLQSTDPRPTPPFPATPDTTLSFATTLGTLEQVSAPFTDVPPANRLTAPGAAGAGSVTVGLDGATTAVRFTVADPPLTATPGALHFGDVKAGSASPVRTVVITNASAETVTITDVATAGADDDDFHPTSSCLDAPIAAGGTCVVEVSFVPGTVGAKTARVEVTSDASPVPTSVDVDGSGVDTALAIAPSPASLGPTIVGTASPRAVITITNTGASGLPVRIRNLVLQGPDAGDFTAYLNGCRTTLAPHASCSVSAVLRPTSTGAKTAAIAVIAADEPPRTIDLSGSGVTGFLVVTPPSAAFGPVQVGRSSSRRDVTITNTGPVDSVVRSIQIAGPDFALFAGGCRTTLAPGAGCTFSVFFRPTTPGPKAASVTIASSTDGPHAVALTGRGGAVP